MKKTLFLILSLTFLFLSCNSSKRVRSDFYSSKYSKNRQTIKTISKSNIISSEEIPKLTLLPTIETRNNDTYKYILFRRDFSLFKSSDNYAIPITKEETLGLIKIIDEIIKTNTEKAKELERFEYIVNNQNQYFIFTAEFLVEETRRRSRGVMDKRKMKKSDIIFRCVIYISSQLPKFKKQQAINYANSEDLVQNILGTMAVNKMGMLQIKYKNLKTLKQLLLDAISSLDKL